MDYERSKTISYKVGTNYKREYCTYTNISYATRYDKRALILTATDSGTYPIDYYGSLELNYELILGFTLDNTAYYTVYISNSFNNDYEMIVWESQYNEYFTVKGSTVRFGPKSSGHTITIYYKWYGG